MFFLGGTRSTGSHGNRTAWMPLAGPSVRFARRATWDETGKHLAHVGWELLQ